MDLKVQWRKHRHELLSRDKAGVEGFLQVFMELAQDFALLELLLVGADRIGDVARVPFDDLQFWHLFWFVVLFQLLLHFLLRKLLKLYDFFHKLLVIEFITERLVIRESGVDSEYYRKLLFHRGPELLKLIFGKMKLKLVIFPKDLIILRNGSGAPFLVNFFMSIFVFVIAIG